MRGTGDEADEGWAIDRGELLELVVESAADFAIFTTDPDGIVTSWNTGAERLVGYTEEEMLGRPADAIFVPEDRASGAPEQERRMAVAEGRAIDERWHLRRDGTRFWGSGLLMPLREGDTLRGFAKIVRDRTEHHLVGERLRESEARFRLLARSIPQLVFATRGNGDRTWGSPQWCDFTGLSEPDSLGYGWLDAVHQDDREATVEAWQVAPTAGEYYVEHRVFRAADGTYRWHQTRAKPLVDSGVGGEWVGTSTDIHEIRGLQERQQVLLAELQHRTRNLLAVVQAIAHQTRRTSGSLDDFEVEFENRLRALSRVQGLLPHAERGVVDLRTLVEAELAALGGNTDIAGKVTVGGPTVGLPAGAIQALALALHELATNAVKYGALGQPSGKLTVTWRVAAESDQSWVELDWREAGVRMPPAGTPRRRGYGSELIERALRYQLRARTRLDFRNDGVRCSISIPVPANEGGRP